MYWTASASFKSCFKVMRESASKFVLCTICIRKKPMSGCVFSSPMHEVQGELLWSLTVRRSSSSSSSSSYVVVVVVVRPFTFSYKRLLLVHQLTKFKIILQECSLGGSLSNLFKRFYSMNLYQDCSNYSPGVKNDPFPGITCLTWTRIGEKL